MTKKKKQKYDMPTKILCMHQLVVNMKVNVQNKISRNLKNNRFKMPGTPYLNH